MVCGTIDSPDVLRARVTRHAGAWALMGLFMGGVAAYLPFTARQLGASPTLVAVLVGVPRVALLLAFLYVHYLEHLEGRMLVALPRILGCTVLLGLSMTAGPLAFSLVASVGMLVFLVSDAFYGDLLGRLYPVEQRGRLLMWPMLTLSLATILANLLVGRLLDQSTQSFHWVLPAISVFGILSGLLVMRFPVDAKSPRVPHLGLTACLREGFRDRRFLAWTLLFSLMAVGWWIAAPAITICFNDELKVTNTGFGLAQASFNIAMLMGFLVSGRLLDRWGSVMTICLGWIAIAAGFFIVAAARNLHEAIIGQALQGAGLAANDLGWFPVVLEYSPRDRVHRYMGFYMTMFGVRALIGTCLASAAMDTIGLGSRATIRLGATLIAGIVVVILCFRKHLQPGNVNS